MKPYISTEVPMGRNKEITTDFTFDEQAKKAVAESRKSANDGKMKPANNSTKKVVSYPPLSV